MDGFRKVYRLEFPLDAVYRHWIDEGTVISPASRMEIEAEVDGPYRLVMPGGTVMSGRFLEVIPSRRLRYSWQWVGETERTEVEVCFRDAEGGTEVEVSHTGFDSADSRLRHAQGWDSYLAGLEAHLRAARA